MNGILRWLTPVLVVANIVFALFSMVAGGSGGVVPATLHLVVVILLLTLEDRFERPR